MMNIIFVVSTIHKNIIKIYNDIFSKNDFNLSFMIFIKLFGIFDN